VFKLRWTFSDDFYTNLLHFDFSIKNFSDSLIAFHKVMAKGVVTAFLSFNLHTHTHTCLTALFQDYPGEPVPEMSNQSGFY